MNLYQEKSMYGYLKTWASKIKRWLSLFALQHGPHFCVPSSLSLYPVLNTYGFIVSINSVLLHLKWGHTAVGDLAAAPLLLFFE